MEIKSLLDFELEDIDINIKCLILSLGVPIIRFNCQTSYENRAEETIGEVIKDWLLNGGTIKDAIVRQGLPIEDN